MMTNAPSGLDSTTIILIGGQIVLVIGSIVTGIIAIITHMRVTATTDKLDAVAASTEAIKGHVNSEKTAAEGREAALAKENQLLREMLTEAKTTAGLLAQSKVVGEMRSPALLATAPASAPLAVAPALGPEQKSEVENTKADSSQQSIVTEVKPNLPARVEPEKIKL